MDFIWKVMKEYHWVGLITSVIVVLVVMFIAGIAVVSVWKWFTKINRETKIDQILNETIEVRRTNDFLVSVIHSMDEVNSRYTIQRKILDDYFQQKSEFPKNLLREFLDNVVMISGGISMPNSGLRIMIWSGEKGLEDLTEVVKSSNYEGSSDKKISKNNSIVGRVYRTKKDQVVFSVAGDPEWVNEDDKKYDSIVAFFESGKGKEVSYVISYDFNKLDENFTYFLDFLKVSNEYIVSLLDVALSLSNSYDDFMLKDEHWDPIDEWLELESEEGK